MSSQYNLRYEVNQLHGIKKALAAIIASHEPEEILEVGCGTGHWLTGLELYSARLTGIDSSLGMLKKARIHGNKLRLICADANSLPIMNKRFDMIYCVNAFHHFKDKKEFIRAAANLLEPNGILSIIGVDPRNINDKWYIYDFFEGIYEFDLQRFPSSDEMTNWMNEIGLKEIMENTAERVINIWTGNEVFNDTFLNKNQSSQLASLSDEEYSLGIERIKDAIAQNPKIIFPTRLTFNSKTYIKA